MEICESSLNSTFYQILEHFAWGPRGSPEIQSKASKWLYKEIDKVKGFGMFGCLNSIGGKTRNQIEYNTICGID